MQYKYGTIKKIHNIIYRKNNTMVYAIQYNYSNHTKQLITQYDQNYKIKYNNNITTIQQQYNNNTTTIQQQYNNNTTTIQQQYNNNTTTIQQQYIDRIQQQYNTRVYSIIQKPKIRKYNQQDNTVHRYRTHWGGGGWMDEGWMGGWMGWKRGWIRDEWEDGWDG